MGLNIAASLVCDVAGEHLATRLCRGQTDASASFYIKTKDTSYVFFTFLLTMIANNFIYESHCDPPIANLTDVRENRSMKNATKKAAKKAPAKKAAAKKKK